ncbi:stage III sporulation protein AF [Bacillus massilinigeriensis]|uniref:stage III sporulation protein AF n=1 Tax=Bacillus mediterraneensis TaxID=1805474 RepID=UPI0008F89153|nr:stage III sporulation protein AF [Bacillus mediterraneensis]
MEFLTEWVTNIILFILLATLLEMLLPNSALQKYVKIVTGLLLITIVLSPIFKIFSSDLEQMLEKVPSEGKFGGSSMENLIELKKTEIQESQNAYILEQMAVQLKADAKEEMMEKYHLEIASVEIVTKEQDKRTFPENLEQITVLVREAEGSSGGAVTVVEEIRIDTQHPHSSDMAPDRNEEAAFLLAKKWNVPVQSIKIVSGGGLANGERE